MKAHLLNWVLGSAFFGAVFGSAGFAPQNVAPPKPLESLLTFVSFLGILAGVILVLTTLRIVAGRLIEGRFDWPAIRQFAAVMSVKLALMVFVVALAMCVYQLAGLVLGNWSDGWVGALIGAGVGAVVGLAVGYLIALLRIPERLGLVERPKG